MSPLPLKAHRGTIHVEDARVLSHVAHPGQQFVLRLEAPECARRARPGSFAHIRCDADIPMRRPLSIMRADPATGSVDFLYKIMGPGLRALSRAQVGSRINIMGPIGNGFSPSSTRPRKLMLGGGVGIPPMTFLAEVLADDRTAKPLVMMGSEVPFPFDPVRSKLSVNGLPDSADHAMPELETLGVPSRLASQQDYTGAFHGFVTDLARRWLDSLDETALAEVEVFACGPEPMLAAATRLAQAYGLPCQLCLEEYMACAVGGCAGCTVPVHLPDGIAMKRVCVDGPVFDAVTIYPA